MKFDLSQLVRHYNGMEIRDVVRDQTGAPQIDADGTIQLTEPLNLGLVVQAAVLAHRTNDLREQVAMHKLGKKVFDDGVVDLSDDDVAKLKDLIVKRFDDPMISMGAVSLLDNPAA